MECEGFMSEEKTELEKLLELQNSGVKSVTIGGQTIVYRDNEELEKIIQKNQKPLRANIQRVYNPLFSKDGQ